MFAIVVDSTIDIPLSLAQEQGVTIVPLTIDFDGETYVDGFGLGPEEFYQKLDEFYPKFPKTSCPAPGKFEEAYRKAVDGGADGILCIMLTGASSGTYNSSVVAAQACEGELGVPIVCIDSKSTAAVESMMVEKAVKMRDVGASLEETAQVMRKIRNRAEIYVAMDSIEYIDKGGKIAEGGEGADSGLTVKPILFLRKNDGAVKIVSKSRGAKAQRREMLKIIEDYLQRFEGEDIEIRFSSGNALDQIAELKRDLGERGIAYDDGEIGWTCSLIGVYFGNRNYAVSMCPKELL